MLVIGENINGTRREVAEAIGRKDREFFERLAVAQAEAGADFIDVNAGTGRGTREDQIADVEWLVDVIQAATDRPLSIDSDDHVVMAAALRRYHGQKLLLNSVAAEPERLEAIGALAVLHQAWLVALAMGKEGIPDTAKKRLDACEVIMTFLTRLGIGPERVYFDPLVLPVSVDSNQGLVTLRTLEEIKRRYPSAKTVMGLSNVSYGLPNRKLINRGFLAMAAYAGLDAVILDPLDTKAMSLLKVAGLLLGKDPGCREYLRAHRKGVLVG